MPAGSIPSPLPKWSKWAIALGAGPSSYLVQFLTYLGTMNASDDPSPGQWRHVQIVFTDTTTNDPADTMIVTIDLANVTNGGLDSSWTTADYNQTDGTIAAMVNAWLPYMSSDVSVKEFRYYVRAYNPYSNPKPFTLSGPPEHVHPYPAPGGDTGALPHQVAITHTEKTTFPKHWGRCYWPAIGSGLSNFVAGGKFNSSHVDSLATAIHDAYADLMDAEFFPVIPTTTVLGVASRQLLGVTAIQVDNVADVVRRRRAAATTYRKSLPL